MVGERGGRGRGRIPFGNSSPRSGVSSVPGTCRLDVLALGTRVPPGTCRMEKEFWYSSSPVLFPEGNGTIKGVTGRLTTHVSPTC